MRKIGFRITFDFWINKGIHRKGYDSLLVALKVDMALRFVNKCWF